MGLNWTDVEDIALLLLEKNPDTDPLTLRFTQLRDMILALPGFEGDVARLNEKILEAVQMAWYEEYQETRE